MREHNVFRGRIISLHQSEHGSVGVQYHALPAVQRAEVILPGGTLERLERHAIGIAENAERLRSAGRHLKRGVLLHGPPGTGKTLSMMYLLHAMPGRTTILLTGRGLGLIEQALAIGRELAPATFVFEDIDLVAAERTMEFGSEGVLFELLNQMEGLAEDEDLLFRLSTVLRRPSTTTNSYRSRSSTSPTHTHNRIGAVRGQRTNALSSRGRNHHRLAAHQHTLSNAVKAETIVSVR